MSKLLLIALTACTATARPTPSEPQRVPLSVWALPGNRCEPWWLMPATYCGRGYQIAYDGCRWACGSVLAKGARQ